MDELKKLIQQIGEAHEEFKKANEQQLAELKKGIKRDDLEQKLATISGKLDELVAQKDALEKRMAEEKAFREEVERKFNKLSVSGNPEDAAREAKAVARFNTEVKSLARARGLAEPADLSVEDYNAYKNAFLKWARKGDSALTAEERKAMIVASDADGGYLVMPDTSGRIVTKVYELSPIRQIASVQNISTDALEGIEDLGEASAGWVGEIGSRGDTNTPQVGKYRIEAFEMYAQPKASQKLLDDSSIDIEAWLSGKVSDKFARVEGAAFITGTGVSQPHGFTKYTTVETSDATRAWGQLEDVKTGVNGDFAASSPADILFDLEGAFKPAYLNGASWVTRRSVIVKVRKFKGSDNNYLWQPGLQAGKPATLIGYPIVMAEDMPALGTGSLSMALGNFQVGYQIVDRLGVRVLRDPYTDKPYVKFYTVRRVGGQVVNFEAIKFIKFAA